MISYKMEVRIHVFVSIVATLCILTFFTSTIIVELFASHELITKVKNLTLVPGLFILIPAMAMTGGTGLALSKQTKGPLVDRKKKRMPFIAANGVLVLIPAAFFLAKWSSDGAFDTRFYIVQGIELLVGIVNLSLMGLNIRDGLKVSAQFEGHD